MHLAVLVKGQRILLQAVGDDVVGDDKRLAVPQRLHDQVKDVEQFAGVASREAQQRLGLLDAHFTSLKHLVGLDGMVQQLQQVVSVQRVEDIDLGAGE